jgi:glycosyltransferase involved in cell wall biosynthesis
LSDLIRDYVPESTSFCVAESSRPEIEGRFSVIVPVFNSKEHLHLCLNSILTAMDRYRNAEVIVLDNGSDDGSYEILLDEYSRRARVEQLRGVTVAALRNRGAALAKGEFLSFLDSDCIMDPGYFEQAFNILLTCADATGSKHELPPSPNWIEKTWYEIHARPRDGLVNYINSGNFAIKRRVFLAVGGFDETMIGTEDAELCLRLNRGGFRIYEAHAARAVHLGGDTSLRIFFRKTAWRSLGAFGLLKSTWMTMPLLTTFAHLLLCMGAVVNLVVTPASLLPRLVVFFFLVNLAPTATIMYRGWQIKHFYAPGKAILLYHVYFLARLYSMCKLIFSLDTSSPRVRRRTRAEK